jgi:thiamine-phosphate pyrophosphorylase
MAESCLLYYITDRTAFAPDEPTRRRHLLEKIAEAVHAGVDLIQLREKDLPSRDLECLAAEAMRIASGLRTENQKAKTVLLINSRTDVALAIGADGVHLRSDDISPREVRSIWLKPGPIAAIAQLSLDRPVIGASCHSPKEVQEAAVEGASFAVFAPVFEKEGSPQVQPGGLGFLRKAAQVGIPVLALGGVTLSNAHSCLDAGAAGIAAIRLFQENAIGEVAQRIRR